MGKKIRSTLFSFLAVLFSLFSPIVPKVFANACNIGQSNLDLGDCFALNNDKTVAQVYNKPTVLINLFVRLAFVGGGIILFFLVIAAGYQFISGGTKGPEQAKSIMETALVGFIIMFSAFWILQIIKLLTGADLLF